MQTHIQISIEGRNQNWQKPKYDTDPDPDLGKICPNWLPSKWVLIRKIFSVGSLCWSVISLSIFCRVFMFLLNANMICLLNFSKWPFRVDVFCIFFLLDTQGSHLMCIYNYKIQGMYLYESVQLFENMYNGKWKWKCNLEWNRWNET